MKRKLIKYFWIWLLNLLIILAFIFNYCYTQQLYLKGYKEATNDIVNAIINNQSGKVVININEK